MNIVFLNDCIQKTWSHTNMTQSQTSILLLFCGYMLIGSAFAIDCYVCSSKNNSNEACADPFHPQFSNISVGCRQGMDGRYGLFPARYCIKMKGTSGIDGTETVIRYCAMSTLDNMCGMFKYEGVPYTGCILSCDKRACNAGTEIKPLGSLISILSWLLAVAKLL